MIRPANCARSRAQNVRFLPKLDMAYRNKCLSQSRKFSSAQTSYLTAIGSGFGFGHRGSRTALSMRYERSNKCAPHCPSCAQIMRLARITSRFDDLPELYTFECQACGVSHIEAVPREQIAHEVIVGSSN